MFARTALRAALRTRPVPVGMLPTRAMSANALTVSKSEDVVDHIGRTSGMPDRFYKDDFRVTIYQPCKPATQHAKSPNSWAIRFVTPKTWVNPLMGWTSSSDSMHATINRMVFETREEAVDFASRQGYNYEVLEPARAKKRVKSYADNYKWKGDPPVE